MLIKKYNQLILLFLTQNNFNFDLIISLYNPFKN